MTQISGRAIEMTRTYRVTPERLFSAWTDPALLRRWTMPYPSLTASRCEVDAREGGGYDLVFGEPPAADDYRETAVYEVFAPVSRLVMRLHLVGDGMDQRTRCTLVLTPVEGGTRLDLRNEGFDSDEAAAGHAQGWEACLDGLARVLEQDAVPA